MPAPTGRLLDHASHDTPGAASTGIGGHLIHFSSLLQSLGAILAVPVSIIGAYSVYHSNFSADVFCQNLRASIITTLDKNLDVDTRRVLVRRDVEEFGSKCGRYDPDAKAAFQVLLDRPTEAAHAASALPPEASGHVDVAAQPGRAVAPPLARKVARQHVAPAKIAAVNETPKQPAIEPEPQIAAASPVTLARRETNADGTINAPPSIAAAPLPPIQAPSTVNVEYGSGPEPAATGSRLSRPVPPATIPLLEGFPGRPIAPLTQASAPDLPYPGPSVVDEPPRGSLLERVPVLGPVLGALRVPAWLR